MTDRRPVLKTIAIGLSSAAGCLGTTGDDAVKRLAPERELWSFEADGRLLATPAVSTSVASIGTSTRSIRRRARLTRFETDNVVIAAPVVADDVAYIASNDGRVYALDVL
ncbi:PQQ-binding-like beta-propeller repeat protein [Natrinema pallidum]|uniref:Pyrrolo-quinoline quinone repeat-containing protein n=1 Tax=Natrinema pallidum DSM 3751 TaxID=1227495 RepID=L9YXR0_9EURY|nr:PQQ-binding-like beta-propeller repeat protein [Natrinema pallidum]ELY78909.1 Pyrrolo-quinoline quinone repeat-containing protein [Natrinema pallidum DSM 3751]